nr:RNA-directed DNA polymerase, eukaryota, reverse transcriptase zinc-binding domain protein [Tanacetum cinerariifolium]
MIKNHILYKIGNGKDTFIWYDNWSGTGPLINIITHKDLYNARLNKKSYVADMIVDGDWKNVNEWVNNVSFLSTIEVPVINQKRKDTIVWLDNKGMPLKFSMKNVYDDIREHSEDVKWGKLIWVSQCILKHTFILWMAVQDRLLNMIE